MLLANHIGLAVCGTAGGARHLLRTRLQRCAVELAYSLTPVLRADLLAAELQLQRNPSARNDGPAALVVCSARTQAANIFITRDTVLALRRISARLAAVVAAKHRALQGQLQPLWARAASRAVPARSGSAMAAPDSPRASGLPSPMRSPETRRGPSIVPDVHRLASLAVPSPGFNRHHSLSRAPAIEPLLEEGGPTVVAGRIDVQGQGVVVVCFQTNFADPVCLVLRLGQ